MKQVAVVGCGYWGKNLVRNFHALEALGMVCDSTETGRETAAQIAPGIALLDSFEEILASEVDAVALATPAETHHPLALQAMEAGKDVFVEKPLALNYRQGVELEQAAASQGRILMVGHLLEYHPAVLALRERIDAGQLGRINYLYSHRLNFGKVRVEENALWSFAPHDIAVILRLVGELPLEVTSVGGNYITPNLADVTVSCLHFRTGLRAHVFVSWLNPFKEQKLVVVGDRKMAVFNDTVSLEEKLVLYDQHVEVAGRQPVLHRRDCEAVTLADEEPLRNECRHFLECLESRRQPLTDATSGVAVLQVLQACQISLQLNGRPTTLSEVRNSP